MRFELTIFWLTVNCIKPLCYQPLRRRVYPFLYRPAFNESGGTRTHSSFFVDPTGIEPVPLVLQTSVRTSYTKGPILTTTWLLSNFGGSYHSFLVVQGVTHPSVTLILLSPDKRLPTLECFLVCGTLWNRTTPSYRTILQTAYHTSDWSIPILYLVVESNYCHFHVKEIRSHYANEASATPDHN